MIICMECELFIQLSLRSMILRVLCCMVDSEHLHVLDVEVFFVLVLILAML